MYRYTKENIQLCEKDNINITITRRGAIYSKKYHEVC